MNWRFNIYKALVWFGVLLLAINVSGQLDLFPLQQDYIEESRYSYGDLDSATHTSILPFSVKDSELSESYFYRDTSLYYNLLAAKVFKDDLFSINEEDFVLRINPLFDFRGAKDLIDTSTYADTTLFIQNSRGFKMDGKIGKRLFFQTGFLENQSYLPSWQKTYADTNLVIPGMGRHKAYKDSGFDYSQSYGWVNYFPVKNINLFFGHGKMFSGHGYRSHLLSHQSFNFPHLKASVTLLKGKLKAMWSLAALQSLSRKPLGEVPESLFKKKSATFSSLSYLVGKRVELSVFETNIWKRYSEFSGTVPLNGLAYAPVPLLGYLTQRVDSLQSARIGFNGLLKISNRIQFYSQYQIETEGLQLGIRINESGIKGLRVQAEYNQANKVAEIDPMVSFSHLNEGLGHPVQDTFDEVFISVNYIKNRWLGKVSYSQVNSLADRKTLDVNAAYLVNAKTNLKIALGYLYRDQGQGGSSQSGLFYFGVKTSVFDSFYNF